MDAEKVEMFLVANQKFFPFEQISVIKKRLLALDDARLDTISTIKFKEPSKYLLISIFAGVFGVDRFMLGNIGMGIFKLLTFGLCGILWIADICSVKSRVEDLNFKNLLPLLQ